MKNMRKKILLAALVALFSLGVIIHNTKPSGDALVGMTPSASAEKTLTKKQHKQQESSTATVTVKKLDVAFKP